MVRAGGRAGSCRSAVLPWPHVPQRPSGPEGQRRSSPLAPRSRRPRPRPGAAATSRCCISKVRACHGTIPRRLNGSTAPPSRGASPLRWILLACTSWATVYRTLPRRSHGFTTSPKEATETRQYYLGLMYYNGRAVSCDRVVAATWFRRAADQWHHEAEYRLGLMYRDGTGVPQDLGIAAGWLRRAAACGHVKARFVRDRIFRTGKLMPLDPEEQFELADGYFTGHDMPQDHDAAAVWFRLAADQGHADAACRLGDMYDKGHGVPQDYAESAKLLRYARPTTDTGLRSAALPCCISTAVACRGTTTRLPLGFGERRILISCSTVPTTRRPGNDACGEEVQ